jgi:uncharacterized protein YcaQ
VAPPTISNDRARRIALAAQGFRDARPSGRVDARHFSRVLGRVGVLQLDSVNVVCRAHFMPVYSRLGPYDRESLDRWAYGGALFEYWAHEAALMPVHRRHLMGFRMADEPHWNSFDRLKRERPGYIDDVLDIVRRRGPLTVSDLDDRGPRTGPWWGRDHGKLALEYLFDMGQVTTADRVGFKRVYDIAERVFPADVLARPALPAHEAQKELLVLAARSLGVGTAEDLGDYYRIRMPVTRPLLDELEREGRLERVDVRGWSKPAYLHPEAVAPHSVPCRTLLSPFDPVVWFRERALRLFDFHYRIEIYVPEAKRVYGYYVLPFLLDGELVARVDLKADRSASTLVVKGAWAEPGVDAVHVAEELRRELETYAAWLDLGSVDVVANGDLAPLL